MLIQYRSLLPQLILLCVQGALQYLDRIKLVNHLGLGYSTGYSSGFEIEHSSSGIRLCKKQSKSLLVIKKFMKKLLVVKKVKYCCLSLSKMKKSTC